MRLDTPWAIVTSRLALLKVACRVVLNHVLDGQPGPLCIYIASLIPFTVLPSRCHWLLRGTVFKFGYQVQAPGNSIRSLFSARMGFIKKRPRLTVERLALLLVIELGFRLADLVQHHLPTTQSLHKTRYK